MIFYTFTFVELLYVFITSIAIPIVVYAFVIPETFLVYAYWVLIICFGLTSIWVFVESISSLVYHSNRTMEDINNRSILVLIPAYMDNEQYVLQETLVAFSQLKYDGSLKVIVVFNAKSKEKTQEFEDYLYSTWDNKQINNIMFEVLENKNSKSKAENINYALKITCEEPFDFICVYDADHQPTQHALENALHTMIAGNYDVVQGQCAIRNIHDTFLSRIVTMEFTEMYNIGHQGRVNVFGLGIFGGSNGMWKANLLRKVEMNHKMLTEDIDSSFNSLTQGARISYSRDMVSYELAPIYWDVLVKQRKRWAQGWFEVSIKYCWKCVTNKHFSLRQKIGSFLVLFWRDVFVYLTFHPLCIIAGDYIQKHHLFKTTNLQIGVTVSMVFLGMVKSSLVFFVANDKMRQELPKYWYVIYVLLYPFYAIAMNMIHISTHYRYLAGKNE